MAVAKFEYLHGIVLTKLVRSDRPTTLRMIETSPGATWARYRVNDECDLLIKTSMAARPLVRERGVAWTFNFPADEARRLRANGDFVALVCATKEVGGPARVCLLRPGEVAELLPEPIVDGEQRGVTIKAVERKYLRVTSHHEIAMLIPQGRLETMTWPGN